MAREKKKPVARWKKILLAILSTVFTLIICALVVVKVFVVKTVKVEGNELYDEALIKSTVLNDEYSWNSLYVFFKYAFSDTQQLPFIDTMEITMENPQTLKIRVYEKGVLGYLYTAVNGQNAYFDKDGIVVETSTRVIQGVPKIEGLECDTVVLYEKLPIDDKVLKELLTLTRTLDGKKLKPDAISYGEKYSPILQFDDINVSLGSIDYLTEKIERVENRLPVLNGMAGTLHLEHWSHQNTNIRFTPSE